MVVEIYELEASRLDGVDRLACVIVSLVKYVKYFYLLKIMQAR